MSRMRSWLGFAVLALAAAVVSAMPAHAERKVALLIGNSAYTAVPALRNPANDVALMARTLREAGFESVETALNLDDRALRQALRRFEDKAADADVGLVFYSGHGVEMNGQNYLVPVNAQLASDGDVKDEAIPLDRVLESLDRVKRLKLVILDACRDNPFLATMARSAGTRSVGRGLARVEPQSTGTLIAYAAKAGTTASDGAGANSPFTTALARHLVQPGLDVRLALGHVRDEVMTATGQKQEPFVYGSLGGGTLTLGAPEAPKPVAAPAPALVAPPVSQAPDNCTLAATHWTQAEKIDRVEFYEEHLKLFPSCPFAGFARLKIAEKQKIAALPPPAPAPPPAPGVAESVQRTLGAAELARAIQLELKRVGCDPGRIDGSWSPATQTALASFNRHAKASVDVKVASLGALDALRSREDRACPLSCPTGTRAADEQCVPIVCAAGKVLSPRGVCVDAPRAAAPKPAPTAEAAPAQPAAPAGKAAGMYDAPQPGMKCSQVGLPQMGTYSVNPAMAAQSAKFYCQ
ncbi:caspase family protein [Alsobacter sp. R-9]